MEIQTSASIVLPTHGRRASLLRVLYALGQQRVPSGTFEAIVICDGDVDGSAQACHMLMRELPYPLRVIEQDNQGPAAARNRGVAEARAPLIVFLDDDVVPDEHLVSAHLKAHQGQEHCVTIGPLLPPPDARLNAWGAWEERVLCRQYDDMLAGRWQATYRQFYTGNAAVLKRHIQAVGGFDPSFRRAEDVELARRLHAQGLRFVFLPGARGWHYVQRSFAAWLRIPIAYGAADVEIARNGHGETLAIAVHEYQYRNRAVRLLTNLCVGRASAVRTTVALLGLLVRVADATRITVLGHVTCSLIFNLCYYDGLANALGGRTAFQRLVHGVHNPGVAGTMSKQ